MFRELRVYPTREAVIARFRPVPDQPVLGYIADHVTATSVRLDAPIALAAALRTLLFRLGSLPAGRPPRRPPAD